MYIFRIICSLAIFNEVRFQIKETNKLNSSVIFPSSNCLFKYGSLLEWKWWVPIYDIKRKCAVAWRPEVSVLMSSFAIMRTVWKSWGPTQVIRQSCVDSSWIKDHVLMVITAITPMDSTRWMFTPGTRQRDVKTIGGLENAHGGQLVTSTTVNLRRGILIREKVRRQLIWKR